MAYAVVKEQPLGSHVPAAPSSPRRGRGRDPAAETVMRRTGDLDGLVVPAYSTLYRTGAVQIPLTRSDSIKEPTNVLYIDPDFSVPGINRVGNGPAVTGYVQQHFFAEITSLGKRGDRKTYTDVKVVKLRFNNPRERFFIMRRFQVPKTDGTLNTPRDQALTKLLHPLLPRVYLIFREGEHVTLIEEFIVRRRIRSNFLTTNESLLRLYIVEMLLLMGHFHSNGLVIGDLAPDTLLLTMKGHLRMIDTRFQWSIVQHFGHGRSRFTLTPYSAPELVTNPTDSARFSSDLWSLGATVLTLLTGEEVFPTPSTDAKLTREQYKLAFAKAMNMPNVYVNGIRPSRQLRSLLESLLDVEPSARPTYKQALRHPYLSSILIDSVPWHRLDALRAQHISVWHPAATWVLPAADEAAREPSCIDRSCLMFTPPLIDSANHWPVKPTEMEYELYSKYSLDRSRMSVNSSASNNVSLEKLRSLTEDERRHDYEMLRLAMVLRFEPRPASLMLEMVRVPFGRQFGDTFMQSAEQAAKVKELVSDNSLLDSNPQKLKPSTFLTVGPLGSRSTFSEAKLVTLDGDKKKRLYVLKRISTTMFAKQHGIAEHHERLIMTSMRSSMLVQLHYAFQQAEHVYLVLEFCQRGSLENLFATDLKPPLEKDLVLFYIAEIAVALEHMHSRGIVHRDLRPRNILMRHDGHLRVADIGLSRYLPGADADNPGSVELSAWERMYPDSTLYMSPEMVDQHGPRGRVFGRSVDAWALGVIAFFMMTGKHPVPGDSRVRAFKELRAGNLIPISSINRDVYGQHAQDFVRALLCLDPADRLGTRSRIIDHAFFAGTNWVDVMTQTHRAPFVPNVGKLEYNPAYFQKVVSAAEPTARSKFAAVSQKPGAKMKMRLSVRDRQVPSAGKRSSGGRRHKSSSTSSSKGDAKAHRSKSKGKA